MTRWMPALLDLLAEALALGLLGLAIARVAALGWATTSKMAGYGVLFTFLMASGLIFEEMTLARFEERRARSAWAVLGGSVELEPRRPLTATLMDSLGATLCMLTLGRIPECFRPPASVPLTPSLVGLLYAYAVAERLLKPSGRLKARLSERHRRPPTCSPH